MRHSCHSLQQRAVPLAWVGWNHALRGWDQVSLLFSLECWPQPQESKCPARGSRGNVNLSSCQDGSLGVAGSCANPHVSSLCPCSQIGGRKFSPAALVAVDTWFSSQHPGYQTERISSRESTSSTLAGHLCGRMSLTCLAASCPQTLASLPIWHLTYRGQAYL